MFGSLLVKAKLTHKEIPSMNLAFKKLSYGINSYHDDIIKQLNHDHHLELLIDLLDGKPIASETMDMFNEMGLLGDYYGTQYTITPHFTDCLHRHGYSCAITITKSEAQPPHTASLFPLGSSMYVEKAEHVTVVNGDLSQSPIGAKGADATADVLSNGEMLKRLSVLLRENLNASEKQHVEEAISDLQQNKSTRARNVLEMISQGACSPMTRMTK